MKDFASTSSPAFLNAPSLMPLNSTADGTSVVMVLPTRIFTFWAETSSATRGRHIAAAFTHAANVWRMTLSSNRIDETVGHNDAVEHAQLFLELEPALLH